MASEDEGNLSDLSVGEIDLTDDPISADEGVDELGEGEGFGEEDDDNRGFTLLADLHDHVSDDDRSESSVFPKRLPDNPLFSAVTPFSVPQTVQRTFRKLHRT